MIQRTDNSSSHYVFRLLGRQRARVQRTPGATLDARLAVLRQERRSALIELELPDLGLGYLLLQAGRLVHAQLGDSGLEEALQKIWSGASNAYLYVLELDEEQTALACAAVAGTPWRVGETLVETPSETHVETHLETHSAGSHADAARLAAQLREQKFSGVLAMERGMKLLIWRFHNGEALSAVEPPEGAQGARFTQISWPEQALPELNGAKSGSGRLAQTQAAPPLPPRTASRLPARESSEVWAHFQTVMYAHLGNRAARMVKIIRNELGEFTGAELAERLAEQVERVAGTAAARTFEKGI